MSTTTLLLLATFVDLSYASPIKPFASREGRLPNKLLNVSAGRLIPGIGGIGGDQKCDRLFNPDCSALPRQMVFAVDYTMDPTGKHLYVATRGINYVGECIQEGKIVPACKSVAIHDNTSRLIHYDLESGSEPVTLSYCGPWNAVEYDAHRKQVVALRNVNLKSDEHGTHYASEVVAFDVANGPIPAEDKVHQGKECYNQPTLDDPKPATCACISGFDPDGLNGKVIGRKGLQKDGIQPPSTMTLLGDDVLVGDQNQYCVVAFPLDGSAGSSKSGTPVAGTCGHSCGQQGCASIGSPSNPAGKKLGNPDKGAGGLEYELYTTPGGRLYLHDNNQETIDYGSSPKAATNFMTVPVDPGASSVYHKGTFSAAGDMLVTEAFTYNGVLLKQRKGTNGEPSYGHAKTLISKEQLTGTYQESRYPNGTDVVEAQGIPMQWKFIQNDKKVLALVSYALEGGSAFFDHAFVEFDVA